MAATLALALVAALVWLYGTRSGRQWRLERQTTPDLMALALSAPNDRSLVELLGRRLIREARYDEAASVFASAAAADAAQAWPVAGQGRALLAAGRPAEALAPLDAAARRAPGDATIAADAGRAAYDAGDAARAEERFKAALAVEGRQPTALAGMAFVLADRHQHDEARRDADRAVSLAPTSAYAWMAKGYAADKAGDPADANRAFARAVELEPNYGRAWGMLGAVRTRLARRPEDYAAADRALDRADALLPTASIIPYYRGLLRLAQRRYPESIQLFRTALQRDPNSTDALYNESLALALTGERAASERARAQFEAARDYHRDVTNLQLRISRDPTSRALLARLRTLGQAHGDTRLVQEVDRRLGLLR